MQSQLDEISTAMRSEGVTRRYSSEGTESSEEWASSRCFPMQQKFGNITEYRFNGKCIECGKQGHMSRDCFKKGYFRSCQKYGHRGGQCQKGRDASLCDKTVFLKIPGAPSQQAVVLFDSGTSVSVISDRFTGVPLRKSQTRVTGIGGVRNVGEPISCKIGFKSGWSCEHAVKLISMPDNGSMVILGQDFMSKYDH